MVVALAALISACRAAEDGGTDDLLRATLPLAGGTLIEHQARLAAAAGAGPIIILVERLPAGLTAAVDRLRHDGLRVEIARGLADAVDRIHPDEALLVIADGCIAGADLVRRVADGPLPAVLTVPDDADHAAFERIDATVRWGGLLLIDGARLRHTAAKLGEWDLESTLLRRAVQESAARIGAFETGAAAPVIADRRATLEPLDRALIERARGEAADWTGHYLFPPIVGRAALPLLRQGIAPHWIAVAAVALAMLALPFALFGWRWTALVLLLFSGPVAVIAERLAGVRLETGHRAGGPFAVRAVAAAGALLLLGADLAATRGWGCILLAAVVPLAMLALLRERRIARRIIGAPLPLWLAGLDGLIWIFLPLAVAGSWLGGIALLAAYACGSFAFVQHRLLRAVAEEGV